MKQHPEHLEVRIEVTRGGWIKRRPDHSIDFISPLPSPFNYGSALGREAADGDPEDALVLGGALDVGDVVQTVVWGRVNFIDAGVEDHKWLCGAVPPSDRDWAKVERFFQRYVWAKRILYLFRRVPGEVRFLGVDRFAVDDATSRY